MIDSVILPSTKPQDWPALRQGIRERIVATMGTFPPAADKPQIKEIERYVRHDLLHIHLSYHVIDDHWNEAVLVMPGKAPPEKPTPTVLAVHGSVDQAKDYCLDPVGDPNHAYAIDLARRGYVTMSVDQYGFGPGITKANRGEVYAQFYQRWPEWSLDGVRLVQQQRALDALASLPYVDAGKFGVIGHSLGGRATVNLACLDERIVAAVSSTGISPNCSNIYRYLAWDDNLSPLLSKAMSPDGRIPWEYNEMLSLCAPRAMLVLEPYNDLHNPDVAATMECVYRAWAVYQLLGHTQNLTMLIHGAGHGTPHDVRQVGYTWFDRHLCGGAQPGAQPQQP